MEIKCPHCGTTDLDKLQFREMVPSYRKLNGLRDGDLMVSLESEEDYESADVAELFCTECGRNFPIPDDVTLDFGD